MMNGAKRSPFQAPSSSQGLPLSRPTMPAMQNLLDFALPLLSISASLAAHTIDLLGIRILHGIDDPAIYCTIFSQTMLPVLRARWDPTMTGIARVLYMVAITLGYADLVDVTAWLVWGILSKVI
ncbi:hypothetical protein BST61_g5502 [Cercospora zeina]